MIVKWAFEIPKDARPTIDKAHSIRIEYSLKIIVQLRIEDKICIHEEIVSITILSRRTEPFSFECWKESHDYSVTQGPFFDDYPLYQEERNSRHEQYLSMSSAPLEYSLQIDGAIAIAKISLPKTSYFLGERIDCQVSFPVNGLFKPTHLLATIECEESMKEPFRKKSCRIMRSYEDNVETDVAFSLSLPSDQMFSFESDILSLFWFMRICLTCQKEKELSMVECQLPFSVKSI